MTVWNKAFIGRSTICLVWIAIGTVFILRGPRYVAPITAYVTGMIFILLAIVLIVTAISQRRTKLRARWTRKA